MALAQKDCKSLFISFQNENVTAFQAEANEEQTRFPGKQTRAEMSMQLRQIEYPMLALAGKYLPNHANWGLLIPSVHKVTFRMPYQLKKALNHGTNIALFTKLRKKQRPSSAKFKTKASPPPYFFPLIPRNQTTITNQTNREHLKAMREFA